MNSRLTLACITASLASASAYAIPLKYSVHSDPKGLYEVGDTLTSSDFFQDDHDLAMSDSVYVFIPFSKERARIARDGSDENGTLLKSQQVFGGFGDGLGGGDLSRSAPSYQSAAVIPSVAASFPSRTLAPIQAPAPAVIHTPAAPARSSASVSAPVRSVSLPAAPVLVHVTPTTPKNTEKPKPTDDTDKPSAGGAGVGGSVGNGKPKPASPISPVVDVVNTSGKGAANANKGGKGKPGSDASQGNKPGKGPKDKVASNNGKKDGPIDKIKDGVGHVISRPVDIPKKPAPVLGGNAPVVAPPAPAPVQQAPIPVPDGGSTLFLFGAVTALGAFVRRLQRRATSN